MRHVISREHLLDMLGEIPRPAIRRAALLGRVECLGLFERIVQGDTRPAWMFIVKGTKREWNVALIMCAKNELAFRILKRIPWQFYGCGKGLASGDDSMKYHMRRAFAVQTYEKDGVKRKVWNDGKTTDAEDSLE